MPHTANDPALQAILRIFCDLHEEFGALTFALVAKGLVTKTELDDARTILKPVNDLTREAFRNVDRLQGAELDAVMARIDAAADAGIEEVERAAAAPPPMSCQRLSRRERRRRGLP